MWTDAKAFRERIIRRELPISVVGLGYVGLNLACLFGKAGFRVFGFDIDEKKVEKLKIGQNCYPEEEWLTPVISDLVNSRLFFSTDVNEASEVGEFIAVAVNTETQGGEPCYDHLISAADSIGKNLSRGKLVAFESTVEPGITESILKPVLEKVSTLRAGTDFGLVFSPERIDPGNKARYIWNIPKVVGGIDPLSTELGAWLYSQVIQRVISVSNARTAELAKIMENTQRDVNIALTNLFAKLADKLDIDIEEALDAAATKWNFMRLKPGCGVGGYCLGDVAYMADKVMERNGVDSGVIKECRKVNESMPYYTVDKAVRALRSAGKDINRAKVVVLGLAYKGGCSDTRNSPALIIVDKLKQLGVSEVIAFDPFVKKHTGIDCVESLEEALSDPDCVIIATDHPQFKDLAFDQHAITIDGRNCLRRKAEAYYGIGR